MNNTKLFCDTNGNYTTFGGLVEKLKFVGAQDCSVLFIHTDIMFGKIHHGLKRTEYLELMYQAILSLNVDTIILPSFTFSFCNRESFDVLKSKSYMGVLNEYIRKQEGVERSSDPILSMIAKGRNTSLLKDIGKHSLGENSTYDKLHKTPDTKFLFMGAEIGECFTYIHYMEKMLAVPYRFDMPFSGNITDSNGRTYEDTFYLYAACRGVRPACSYYFGDFLIDKGYLKADKLGGKPLTCISEVDAYREIKAKLDENVNYFLEEPFTNANLEHVYSKGLNGERIISC